MQGTHPGRRSAGHRVIGEPAERLNARERYERRRQQAVERVDAGRHVRQRVRKLCRSGEFQLDTRRRKRRLGDDGRSRYRQDEGSAQRTAPCGSGHRKTSMFRGADLIRIVGHSLPLPNKVGIAQEGKSRSCREIGGLR